MCSRHGAHAVLLLLAIRAQGQLRVRSLHRYLLCPVGRDNGHDAQQRASVHVGKSLCPEIDERPRAGENVTGHHQIQRQLLRLLQLRCHLLRSLALRIVQGSSAVPPPVDNQRRGVQPPRCHPLPLSRQFARLQSNNRTHVHAQLFSTMPERVLAALRYIAISGIRGRSRQSHRRLRTSGTRDTIRGPSDHDHRNLLPEFETRERHEQRDKGHERHGHRESLAKSNSAAPAPNYLRAAGQERQSREWDGPKTRTVSGSADPPSLHGSGGSGGRGHRDRSANREDKRHDDDDDGRLGVPPIAAEDGHTNSPRDHEKAAAILIVRRYTRVR